jgi:hypothetical protein
MRLLFEGHSIVDRGSRGVRFVGRCCEPGDRDRYVTCHVTREALEIFAPKQEISSDALLQAYLANSARINLIASAQYSGGIERPLVTAQDILQLGQSAA